MNFSFKEGLVVRSDHVVLFVSEGKGVLGGCPTLRKSNIYVT
jgi:hypothetical protein